MTAPRIGPCADWTTLADVRACDCLEDPPTDAQISDAIIMASEVLFELSGRRFSGACAQTVRPCAQTVGGSAYAYHGLASFDGAIGWLPSWGSCSCSGADSCSCQTIPQIDLGNVPIVTVDEVRIDGVVLAPTAYRVDEYRWLVRTDGETWPCCQDMLADDATDPDTFAVDFTFGNAPPLVGKRAAEVLACELAKSCAGGECRLPKRVTSITRQGLTTVVLDPFDFLTNGSTGIYDVDLFIKTYNPTGRRRPMSVASPDVGPSVRRVDT